LEITSVIKDEMVKRGLKGDCYAERSIKTEVMVNDGAVEQIKQSDSFGGAVRIFKDGKLGFSFFTAAEPEEIPGIVAKAADTAFIEGYENYVPAGPCGDCADLDLKDSQYDSLTMDERVRRALEIESSAKNYSTEIKFVRDTTFSDTKSEIFFSNTSGAFLRTEKTYFYAFTSAISSDGKNQESSEVMEGSVNYRDIDCINLGKEAGQKAKMLLGGGALKTGSYDIILPPSAGVELLQVLSPLFLASNIRKGKSLLASHKKGDIIASPIFDIRDDALLDFTAGSYSLDGEGTPGQNKALVEKGVLNGFLFDNFNAALLGEKSTGNCIRAGFKGLPDTGVSNFYIPQGVTGKHEAMKNSRGIIINSFMGLHTADPVSGNFSLGINGWLTENGEIKQAVKEMLVTGNIKTLLMNVKYVCDDLKFYFNYGSPSIIIGDVPLAGK
jgi:PmbA protein